MNEVEKLAERIKQESYPPYGLEPSDLHEGAHVMTISLLITDEGGFPTANRLMDFYNGLNDKNFAKGTRGALKEEIRRLTAQNKVLEEKCQNLSQSLKTKIPKRKKKSSHRR